MAMRLRHAHVARLCALLALSASALAGEAALLFKTQLESEGELRVLGAQWRGTPAFEAGRFGGAFHAGSTAVAFPGMGAQLSTSAGAVEVWVRCRQRPAANQRIFYLPARTAARPQAAGSMRMEATPSGVMCFLSETGSPSFSVDWADGQWHHIVWTWQQRAEQIEFVVYIDGAAQKQTSLKGKILELRGDLTVGHPGAQTVLVDGLWLYNQPLPEDEVRLRSAPPVQQGPAICYGGDLIVEADQIAELRGCRAIDEGDAPDGRSLVLQDRQACATCELTLDAGTYVMLGRGFPPGPDRDALYVQLGQQPKQRFYFSAARERILIMQVDHTGPCKLSILADPSEAGTVVDRVILLRQLDLTEEFVLAKVPDAPAKRNSTTTFLASFDQGTADADYARVNRLAGCDSRRLKIGVPGRFGQAVELPAIGPHGEVSGNVKEVPAVNLLYEARQNCPARRATVEFWVKSQTGTNIWADGRDHTFFNMDPTQPVTLRGQPVEGGFAVDLAKTGAGDQLVLDLGGTARVAVPVAGLAPQAWHHVAASWDTLVEPAQLWLCVNGRGRTLKCRQRLVPTEFIAVHWGNTRSYRTNHPLAATIDDLHITDVPLGYRSAEGVRFQKQFAVNEELATKALDALDRALTCLTRLQVEGCWAYAYQHPSLLPVGGSVYRMPADRRRVSMKYGGPVSLASMFLSAYEALGDDRYFEVARRTGQFLLEAQQPGGYWTMGYSLTFDGPRGASDYGRIQDDYQTTPMRFMIHLYRLTGDPAYLDSARRVADFLVKAQNPNGSWPGGYYWGAKKGKTSGGKDYGGGEFNDGAMTDPFEHLLLMYHVTKDESYLDPLIRAADWILESQVRGPAWGWAQQYSSDNRPAWARQHEPPAVCPRVLVFHVARILFHAYFLTGEEKYPLAMCDAVDWLKRVEDPERGWFMYYSCRDGKPCYGVKHKEYPWHDDESKNVPKPVGFAYWSKYAVDAVAAKLKLLKEGKLKPHVGRMELRPSELLALRRGAAQNTWKGKYRDACEKLVHEQTSYGLWVSRSDQPCLGHGLSVASLAARGLVRYLYYVRLAQGQIPVQLVPRGAGGIGQRVWFAPDWYDTPLRRRK